MKTKTFALLLLALFVVSSLQVVWADEDFENEDFETENFEQSEEDVSVNDFNEIEEDDFDILCQTSCKGKKVKSQNYESARCLSSDCKEICKKDGFGNGICTVSEKTDKVKKCYCIKSCQKKDKKHKKGKKDRKHDPISPANPPSDSPPVDGPSPIIPHFPTPDFPLTKTPTNSYTSLEDDDSDIEFP